MCCVRQIGLQTELKFDYTPNSSKHPLIYFRRSTQPREPPEVN
jgi:hypothetical protein